MNPSSAPQRKTRRVPLANIAGLLVVSSLFGQVLGFMRTKLVNANERGSMEWISLSGRLPASTSVATISIPCGTSSPYSELIASRALLCRERTQIDNSGSIFKKFRRT